MNKDIVGQKINHLTILEQFKVPYLGIQKNRKNVLKVKCRCDCGHEFVAYKSNVLSGKTTKCAFCANVSITYGSKYGSLVPLKRISKGKFLCKCDCGKEDECTIHLLKKAKEKKCKWCRHKKKYAPKLSKKEAIENLKNFQIVKHHKAKLKKIGQRIGRLKIISFYGWKHNGKRRKAYYNCKCKCGNIVQTRGEPYTRSCGCLQRESTPKGENQSYSKLSNKEVMAIREFAKANVGYNGRELAKIFGVSESVISSVLLKKTYKHLE